MKGAKKVVMCQFLMKIIKFVNTFMYCNFKIILIIASCVK